jgi:hypothetical protein
MRSRIIAFLVVVCRAAPAFAQGRVGQPPSPNPLYIRPSEHKKLKDDIANFIQGTRGSGAVRAMSAQ